VLCHIVDGGVAARVLQRGRGERMEGDEEKLLACVFVCVCVCVYMYIYVCMSLCVENKQVIFSYPAFARGQTHSRQQ
jgi:hypothetical protein